jgi:hypothetical protein
MLLDGPVKLIGSPHYPFVALGQPPARLPHKEIMDRKATESESVLLVEINRTTYTSLLALQRLFWRTVVLGLGSVAAEHAPDWN